MNWIDDCNALVVLRDSSKAELIQPWCNPEKKKKKRPFRLESYDEFKYGKKNDTLPTLECDEVEVIRKRKYQDSAEEDRKRAKPCIIS